MRFFLRSHPVTVACALVLAAHGAAPPPGPAEFAAPKAAVLDKASFAQWAGGHELPFPDPKLGPQSAVWTADDKIDWRGVRFGEGREPGIRHLRIGFAQPLATGSVLVRGGGVLSVLKPGAAYPGNLADDSQWLPAERLVNGVPAHAEVGEDGYGLWVLPPATETRALRFSHIPAPGDREMAGQLGGLWLLPGRWGNVAPQALAQSVARDDVSTKLVDEGNNKTWNAWDNGEKGAALPVSAEHPEIVTLTWNAPVKLGGLCLLWAGFQAVEVDAFTGGADENVREAAATKWKRIGGETGMDALYPLALGPHWLSFAEPVQTRALRLRIVQGAKSGHPHLADKVKDGKRVWLGEVMALAPLQNAALASVILPKATEEPPPIPVKFTLPEAGVVTLVIEDAQGHRIRNLVSETPFPAGENIAWWDGSDDLLRDSAAASHGVYNIPTRPVAPGAYQVRGLWHQPVELHYEFSIYNAGQPAWETADKTGCWMTTHTPPTSIAVVPGSRTADGQPLVFIGAYVAEGGHGLQWLHEDGTKLGGQGWVGGNWTGAPTLAVDLGAKALADHLCYVGSTWEGELRLTAKTKSLADQPILKTKLLEEPNSKQKGAAATKPPELAGFDGGNTVNVLAGIAAHDGILVCSLLRQNELLFVDVKAGKIVGRAPVENPRGLTFDAQGRLLVLSKSQLLRYPALHAADPAKLGASEVLLAKGLDDPRHVSVDAAGNIYLSNRGASHQVRVFSPAGELLRTVGHPGAPAVGNYDAEHLNNPNGLAVDSQGRLWVAEADNQPRRVSVWNAKAEFLRAFYGPTEYGGGGVLDSQDASVFFYKGMEFHLNWLAGRDQLRRIFYRPDPLLEGHYGHYSPDTPLYPAATGKRYFTSCYTHNPTNGDSVAFVWRDDEPAAKLTAALGSANAWPLLSTAAFRALWPEGTKPDEENPRAEQQCTFAWGDANGDGVPQPDEVKMVRTPSHGVTVMNDLSFIVSRFGDKSARFAPIGFDAKEGAPVYDVTKPELLGPAGGPTPSSGGDQALADAGGWVVSTNAPAPYSPYGPGGSFKGEARWSYPCAWPGLHASHEAAVPDRLGEVIGTTRMLGGWVRPPGEGGPMFCINGNMGNMYLFTADGLFVSTLFNDIRLRPGWAAPLAVRNMDVTGVSLHDENFWPSITQTPDGRVFLIDGGRTSLVRVDHLSTIKRLPAKPLTVTAADLEKARDWFARAETARQKARGSGILHIPVRASAPAIDGHLDDWPAPTEWATIDRRGTKANFNSNSKPYEVSAAVCVSGDRLYAAWRTTEKNLLENTGDNLPGLFKTGGCLDVMLGTSSTSSLDRPAPVAGDLRLLVTQVKGKTRAVLYRAKVPGTKDPVAFSSPWRTITIDVVEDVTDKVALATDGDGNFELSLPLATLGWIPKPGATIRADIGVLRGSNGQTTQRVYWANKATAITADVPSEAELTPRLWGKWQVVGE